MSKTLEKDTWPRVCCVIGHCDVFRLCHTMFRLIFLWPRQLGERQQGLQDSSFCSEINHRSRPASAIPACACGHKHPETRAFSAAMSRHATKLLFPGCYLLSDGSLAARHAKGLLHGAEVLQSVSCHENRLT